MAYAACQFTVQDSQGNTYPGATVTVSKEGGGLAVLYKDRAGTEAQDNPMTSDEFGFVRFYAPAGAYDIECEDDSAGFYAKHEHVAIGTAAERDVDEYDQLGPTLRFKQLVDISGQNLNNLLVSGFYRGNNLTNAPNGESGDFCVIVMTNAASPSDAIQIAIRANSSAGIYTRSRVSNSWGSWTAGSENPISFDAVNVWRALQYHYMWDITPVSSSNVSWDGDLEPNAFLLLERNSVLQNISNPRDGAIYNIAIAQTDDYTISFGNRYWFSEEQGPPTIPPVPGSVLQLTVKAEVWEEGYELYTTWSTYLAE